MQSVHKASKRHAHVNQKLQKTDTDKSCPQDVQLDNTGQDAQETGMMLMEFWQIWENAQTVHLLIHTLHSILQMATLRVMIVPFSVATITF
eukprot:1236982-Rhodomonas_salina.1